MTNFRYPTAAELYALEQLARRHRAEALARVIVAAAAALKSLAARAFGARRRAAPCASG